MRQGRGQVIRYDCGLKSAAFGIPNAALFYARNLRSLLDLDLEWGSAPNPLSGEGAAIKALSFAVRGLANCRDTRFGVLPRMTLSQLPRNALWRFAAGPALAFQRRLSSGRPSRSCAVKLPLPRLPPRQPK